MSPRSFVDAKYSGFFIAILIAALVSIALTRLQSFALLFLPNAAIFAVLLRSKTTQWRVYLPLGFAAILAANLLMGLSALSSVILTLLNTAEISLATLLLRYYKPECRKQSSVAELIQVSAIYVLLALPLISCVSALILGWHFSLSYLQVWINWYLSSASGLAVILLPALMLNLRDFTELVSEKNLLLLIFQVFFASVILLLLLFLVPRPFIYIAFGFAVYALYANFLRLNVVLFSSVLTAVFAMFSVPQYFSGYLNDRDISNIGGLALCFYFPQLICLARYFWTMEQDELKQAKERLHFLSGQLEAILEASSTFAIIACTKDGVISYFNKGAEQLFYYSRDELVGKETPNILFSKEEIARFCEQVSGNVELGSSGQIYVDQARLGPSYSREWQCLRKDRTAIAVRLSVCKTFNADGELTGYVGISADIRVEHATRTALNETLDRLSEQAEHVHTLFEQAPDALMLVNQKGTIEKANQQAHVLFAYPESGLIGMSIESLVPGKFRESHVHHRENYGKAPASRSMLGNKQLEALRKDGETFPVSINLSPVWEGGQYSVITTIHDVSMQVEVEERLRNARKMAEEVSLAKSNFLANMSHEIRTPLNAILSTSKFLNKTQLNAKQTNYVSTISKAGTNLLNTINDILDYSKIEAGKMEVDCREFSLLNLLDDVIDISAAAQKNTEVEIALLIDEKLQTAVIGSEQHLRQVLINLLSNAMKFTEKGSVILQVDQECQGGNSQKLRFSVCDTGIGIEESKQKEIFNAFAQSDASISRRFGGTGLGLSICYKLVELMGGTLFLVSEYGKGSEFSFHLNLQNAERALEDTLEKSKVNSGILLLEQNELVQKSVRRITSALKWPFSCANSQEDFLLCASEFDCLLFSWEGRQPAASLLAALEAEGLKNRCIIIANSHESEDVEPFSREYQLPFLLKPLLASRVFTMVNTLLSANSDRDAENNHQLNEGLDQENDNKPIEGLRILLAEDNDFNQLVARELLEDFQVKLTIVNNGKEALDTLEVASDDFDLVLMDVQMPEMDGFTATQKVRELGIKIPIIAVTAGVTSKEKKLCLDAGMDDFLAKPLDFDCVETVLKHWAPIKTDVQEKPDKNHNKRAPETVPEVVKVTVNEELVDTDIFSPTTLERMIHHSEERKQKAFDLLTNVMLRLKNGLQDVDELVQTGDLDTAKKRLHELRGVIGNFGGRQMAEVMLEVEHSLETLYEQEKTEIHDQLHVAHSQLVKSVESWRARHI